MWVPTKRGLQQKRLFLTGRGSPARAVSSGTQAPLTLLPHSPRPHLMWQGGGQKYDRWTCPFQKAVEELPRQQPLTFRWPHWVAAPVIWSPPAFTAARGSPCCLRAAVTCPVTQRVTDQAVLLVSPELSRMAHPHVTHVPLAWHAGPRGFLT